MKDESVIAKLCASALIALILIIAILHNDGPAPEDPLEKIQREAVERGFAKWETSTRMVWIGKFFVPQTTKTFKWSGDE